MSQAFLAPTFHDDPRVRQAGNAAVGLFCSALTATHGNTVSIPPELDEDPEERAVTDRLVDAGLWTRLDDHIYRIEGEGDLWVRELPEGETAATASLD